MGLRILPVVVVVPAGSVVSLVAAEKVRNKGRDDALLLLLLLPRRDDALERESRNGERIKVIF